MLKQLVRESLYVVDERRVADAIALRASARSLVADSIFRSENRGPQARSFRRDQTARSFRLTNGSRLRRVHHHYY